MKLFTFLKIRELYFIAWIAARAHTQHIFGLPELVRSIFLDCLNSYITYFWIT